MFDESFFVAVSFFTVIGAFIYLKLPSKLMQALDEKSAEIARELDDAKRCVPRRRKCWPIMKSNANRPKRRLRK